MKKSHFIFASLISFNLFLMAADVPNNVVKKTESFDDMLKLLQEKEDLEERNRQLERNIQNLERTNQENQQKYQTLQDNFNTIKNSNKEVEVKSNDLVNDEKKGRLPIPYTIFNINGETHAKVLKLNWYYTFKDDGTTMFNGYYTKDNLFVDDEYLGYKVVSIENKAVKYCSIEKPKECESIKLLDKEMVLKVEKLHIVDGIPNQMLDKKDKFSEVLFTVLKSTNPLTKRITEEEKPENNGDNLEMNLDNIVNPKDGNGNPTGVNIPKNNVPSINPNTPAPVQPSPQPQNNIKPPVSNSQPKPAATK